MNLRGVGISRNERIAPEGGWPVAEKPAEAELTVGQKIVLLKLRAGDLAPAILRHLAEMSAPEPAGSDWRAMIEARYVMRSFTRSINGVLTLTPPGLHKCHEIVRDYALKFSIHQFVRSGAPRSGRVSQCSCGWRSTYARDSRGGESKLASAETWHVRMVGSGQWPPKTDNIQFDFAGVAPLPTSSPDNPGASRDASGMI